jgi:hypothetical protein
LVVASRQFRAQKGGNIPVPMPNVVMQQTEVRRSQHSYSYPTRISPFEYDGYNIDSDAQNGGNISEPVRSVENATD